MAIPSDEEQFLDEAAKLHDDGEYTDAFKIFLHFAECGDEYSQLMVGTYCYKGWGTETDLAKAEYWLKRASESTLEEFVAVALCGIGQVYAAREEYETAIEWLKRSSEYNNAPALFKVGFYYQYGLGVQSDLEKAAEYYQKAAALGHLLAKRHHSLLLISGFRGFLSRFRGLYLFVQSIPEIFVTMLKDPESNRLV